MAKPTRKVSMTSITRKDYVWTAKWKIDSKDKKQFKQQQVQWKLKHGNSTESDKDKIKNDTKNSDTQTFSEFTSGWKRETFYPAGNKGKVSFISCRVRGKNDDGYGPWCDWKKYALEVPLKPDVKWAYNTENHRATVTISTDAGKGKKERYDTQYCVTVTDVDGRKAVALNWRTNRGTSFTDSVDLTSYEAALQPGKSIAVTCEARARGLAGDSETVTRTRTVGIPAPATIVSIKCPDRGAGGRVYVEVKAGAVTDTMQLQRRSGASGSWEDVSGQTDNGSATLSDALSEADPQAGVHVYYRVKSVKDQYVTYSDPVPADVIFEAAPSSAGGQASPKAGTCDIVSLQSGEDGASAAVVVGWAGAMTDIEVSWSADPNAWKSTDQPQTFEAGWADSPRHQSASSPPWDNSTTLHIAGLECGTAYYVRARVRYEEDAISYYSAYTADSTVVPTVAPTNVSASAPKWVARGEDVPVTWTYDGDAVQTEYHVTPSAGGADYASGSDSLGYAAIPAQAYGDATSVAFTVTACTRGGSASSDEVSVGIADAPSCELYCPDAAEQPVQFEACGDSSAAALLCTCSSEGAYRTLPDGDADQLEGDVVWTEAVDSPEWTLTTWSETQLRAALESELLEAEGALGEAQDVFSEMQEGEEGFDEAASAVVSALAALAQVQEALAAHPAAGEVYVAYVSIPAGTDFIDGARYTVSAVPRDGITGLAGASAAWSFGVDWEHQADEPSDEIEIVPDAGERSVTISLAAPSGAAPGDVYDVYRKSGGLYELAYRGAPLDAQLVDPFAPYGRNAELAYRIALRTSDGDVCFEDFPYEMACGLVRVDFDGQSVELPWNIAVGDDYGKDFDARAHMDGRTAGYFGPATTRKGSYASDVVASDDAAVLSSLHSLGEHAGPCFVRTPSGHAFQCSVDASVDEKGSGALASVSISVERVGLTDEFAMPHVNEE